MLFFSNHTTPNYIQKGFEKKLRKIIGFTPSSYDTYYRAFLHASFANAQEDLYRQHNERLEFLGDVILDAIIADYLFKTFPHMDEGSLTKLKTRFVSRSTLNQLAEKIGIPELIVGEFKNGIMPEDVKGNALEALIGAMYLDKGFTFTYKKTLSMFDKNINLLALVNSDNDYKSKLVKWSQKNKQSVRFEHIESRIENNDKIYTVTIFVNNIEEAQAEGKNKKAAEQKAAELVCTKWYV